MNWLNELKKEFDCISVEEANEKGFYSLKQISDFTNVSERTVSNLIYSNQHKYEHIKARDKKRRQVKCWKPKNQVQEVGKGKSSGSLLGKKASNRG